MLKRQSHNQTIKAGMAFNPMVASTQNAIDAKLAENLHYRLMEFYPFSDGLTALAKAYC